MIKAEIDDAALTKAVEALQGTDVKLGGEFQIAGVQSTRFVSDDLRSGVASVSGDLRGSITGRVVSVVGANVESRVTANAVHRGYNYGARLDRDGRMVWQSGKYAGRRTWGWFSYVLPRVGRKAVKRYFLQAIERVVVKLARAMGAGGS